MNTFGENIHERDIDPFKMIKLLPCLIISNCTLFASAYTKI